MSLDTVLAQGHEGRGPSLWSMPLSPLENALITFGAVYNPRYDWDKSTEDNYRSSSAPLIGRFKEMRERIDYSYHSNYTCARQLLQDVVIASMLNTPVIKDHATGKLCSSPAEPWIVFTAGSMGSGKTHTTRRLAEQGIFPLEAFVTVDPDEIRRLLPEFSEYVEMCPEKAGEMTRKEAGMMAEILTFAALERGQNVLVDGSLRDSDWYQKYFSRLRELFPKIRIAIIHVTAPIEAIFERARVS